MTQPIEKQIIGFIEGVLNSYSQIFFSKNKWFALILLTVTFFDWLAGLSGLFAVVSVNALALAMGYNSFKIREGLYGFNSLLVGLGLGIYYQPGIAFFILLVFASLFTLFLTIWLENHFGKYGLPFLAWPFLFGIWMVSLASRQFTALEVSERGLYMINDMYGYGGTFLVEAYHWMNSLPIHESILIYFQSLGAIFFQYHLLAGLLIAIGLLMYSRIAFLLSVIGFFSAYFYYLFIGANFGELSYYYIGFNYILTAIAIGGFFLIPSKHSFLWVLLLTPIISIIITSTSGFFANLQLSIYSLAFNIIVVMFVYVLKFRERNFSNPELVAVQQYSPEKNLYTQQNFKNRFDESARYTQITLPFWGEWNVTQAHNGKHTHKEGWRHAWDFEILDDEGKSYSGSGDIATDYFCYNQPVIAPADGIVQEIRDDVEDNKIGDVNLNQNWGNTIIIKHADNLYSKISHLKPGSFKVKTGDEIKKGTLLANVGNSGRSPFPHIHFQIQKDPFIGSKTLDYALSDYLVKTTNGYDLRSYDRPKEHEVVSNISKNDTLFKAFNFVPGQFVAFEYAINEGDMVTEEWEVLTDIYNNTYLKCKDKEATAWFKNDGRLFYFTQFTGDKNTLLYFFYLGAYKVSMAFKKNLYVRDQFPIAVLRQSLQRFFQDFIAPFHIFMRADFEMNSVDMTDDLTESSVALKSKARLQYAKSRSENYSFDILIENDRIMNFDVHSAHIKIHAKEVKS
jgi:urea transporter